MFSRSRQTCRHSANDAVAALVDDVQRGHRGVVPDAGAVLLAARGAADRDQDVVPSLVHHHDEGVALHPIAVHAAGEVQAGGSLTAAIHSKGPVTDAALVQGGVVPFTHATIVAVGVWVGARGHAEVARVEKVGRLTQGAVHALAIFYAVRGQIDIQDALATHVDGERGGSGHGNQESRTPREGQT